MKPLPLAFFRRPVEVVARDLLGATIISGSASTQVSGLIVETEAYQGFDDPASHAYRGRHHPSNECLYSAPGTWYVYRSYGIHWCANLVAGGAPGSAVLLRAMWLREGIRLVRRRRGPVRDRDLANGPGKLCQALAITREFDGVPMPSSALVVAKTTKRPVGETLVTPRIGITKAVDWPLRFVLREDPAD